VANTKTGGHAKSIYLRRDRGCAAVRSDSAATVGGFPTRVLEVEVTQRCVGCNQVGDLYTEYVVELPRRPFITARTRGGQENYATSRQVLREMIQTLQVLTR
jgi:hypothetical protein